MWGTKVFVSLFGYHTHMLMETQIRIVDGIGGVNVVYSCLGYGVTSFWIAFVFANRGSWKRKLAWMIGGTLALWFINVLRLSLVMLANNNNWAIPFGWDHHTWFNIFAYVLIFLMIYVYDKNLKKQNQRTAQKDA